MRFSPAGIWSPSHRRGLLVILTILLAVFTVRLLRNSRTIPDPQLSTGPLADRLADRLDPNTADAAELAAIPSLGEKRARAIVEYRNQFQASHLNQPAFKSPEDLNHVAGIGPAFVEAIEPYLIFHNISTTRASP